MIPGQQHENGEQLVWLLTAVDEIQAAMVEELLKAQGIPVLRKYREAGGYLSIYMGMTSYGIDLYVSVPQLAAAKQLVEGILPENEEELPPAEDQPVTHEQPVSKRQQKWWIWIILVLITPGFLWILVQFVRDVINLLNW